jgi:predicted ATPase
VKWKIRDFKGISEAEVVLDKGHATVLTGVNSSGKSSIIQSLLMIAQSLQSKGPVILNGALVRLGDPKDLVREGQGIEGIELVVEVDRVRGSESVCVKHRLVPASESGTLDLQSVELQVGGVRVSAEKIERYGEDFHAVATAFDDRVPTTVLKVKSSEARIHRTYLAFQGIRPLGLVRLYTAAQVERRYAALAKKSVLEDGERRTPRRRPAKSAGGAPSLVAEFVHLLETREDRLRIPAGRSIRLTSARNGNTFLFGHLMQKFSDEEKLDMVRLAAQERAHRPHVRLAFEERTTYWRGLLEGEYLANVEDLFVAFQSIAQAWDDFGSAVQYLGPLRDEPRVVWGHWNETSANMPVGSRGEYSAAVLAQTHSTVNFRDFVEKRDGSGLRAAPLHDAVNLWLERLGIANEVSTRPRGKLGVGIDLKLAGARRDFTSVGVGVSQALPLVVAFLVAPKGSIFIVEQPELHLHPSVQAAMADFLTTARPDMTVLVETHSDAYITRVRRRVAEGELAANDVDIVFVEPGKDGAVARRLELNSFGDLSEWPEGFISGYSDDIEAIFEANLHRD